MFRFGKEMYFDIPINFKQESYHLLGFCFLEHYCWLFFLVELTVLDL